MKPSNTQRILTGKILVVLSPVQVKMSRLKFPLTRRDKFYIFGNEEQILSGLDGQEFFIRGAVCIYISFFIPVGPSGLPIAEYLDRTGTNKVNQD